MNDGTSVFFGGEVKALGEGKFEAPLVTFGSAVKTDLAADFFVPETDFWVEMPARVPLLYAHALDSTMKATRLGVGGVATLERKDAGIWMQGQLNLANEYEAAIYKLIDEKKMGTSSGSAAHLVAREPVGKAWKVTRWPIVEASLTPTPCEPQNRVRPLKSLIDLLDIQHVSGNENLPDGLPFADELEAALAAVTSCTKRAERLHSLRIKDARTLSDSVRSKLSDVSAGLCELLALIGPDDRDALEAQRLITQIAAQEAERAYYNALYGMSD